MERIRETPRDSLTYCLYSRCARRHVANFILLFLTPPLPLFPSCSRIKSTWIQVFKILNCGSRCSTIFHNVRLSKAFFLNKHYFLGNHWYIFLKGQKNKIASPCSRSVHETHHISQSVLFLAEAEIKISLSDDGVHFYHIYSILSEILSKIVNNYFNCNCDPRQSYCQTLTKMILCLLCHTGSL